LTSVITYVILMLFSIHGLCFSKNTMKKMLVIGIITIFTLGPIMTNAISRYRMPVTPLIILLASYSMTEFHRIRYRKPLEIVFFAITFTVMAIFFYAQCPTVTESIIEYADNELIWAI
ncbi:MAG: hypothetical protein ABIH11_06110, partial [Candidatus Altiarchaeota archaeon]